MPLKRSINMLTNRQTIYSNVNRFTNIATISKGNIINILNEKEVVVVPVPEVSLSKVQYDILELIQNNYTSDLASQKYYGISSDLDEYIYLLNGIKEIDSIKRSSNVHKMLTTICINSLIGSLDMYSVYQKTTIHDIKMFELNKTLDEILSDKNKKVTLGGVKGNFSARKTIKLSPIYSNYIQLYGLPKYGVGFDSMKLAYLAKTMKDFPVYMIE